MGTAAGMRVPEPRAAETEDVTRLRVLHGPPDDTWTCWCGDAWPCARARAWLAEEYAGDPLALAMRQATELVDAMRTLRDVPAGVLYERFLGWVRGIPLGG